MCRADGGKNRQRDQIGTEMKKGRRGAGSKGRRELPRFKWKGTGTREVKGGGGAQNSPRLGETDTSERKILKQIKNGKKTPGPDE